MSSGSASFFRAHGFRPDEIEPGRRVPNNWQRALTETWEQRKARRAAERQARDGSARASS